MCTQTVQKVSPFLFYRFLIELKIRLIEIKSSVFRSAKLTKNLIKKKYTILDAIYNIL